jgi:hypothetical protein
MRKLQPSILVFHSQIHSYSFKSYIYIFIVFNLLKYLIENIINFNFDDAIMTMKTKYQQ